MTKKRNLTASLMRGLFTGRPVRNDSSNELWLIDQSGDSLSSWRLDYLSPADLGYAFERVVGLSLEDQGYTVDFRGLRLKMMDGGVDLTAVAPSGAIHFYQCKATRQNIGPQEIESILYKVGNFIAKQNVELPCHLILAVVDRTVLSAKAMHRWNRHNLLQNRVHLRVEEYSW